MRITQAFTYSGGPLDGQRALPTSARGKQYTIYRTADGQPLRPSQGDRYHRAEAAGRPHPGWYSCESPTGVDVETMTMHGVYNWNPPIEKAETR